MPLPQLHEGIALEVVAGVTASPVPSRNNSSNGGDAFLLAVVSSC